METILFLSCTIVKIGIALHEGWRQPRWAAAEFMANAPNRMENDDRMTEGNRIDEPLKDEALTKPPRATFLPGEPEFQITRHEVSTSTPREAYALQGALPETTHPSEFKGTEKVETLTLLGETGTITRHVVRDGKNFAFRWTWATCWLDDFEFHNLKECRDDLMLRLEYDVEATEEDRQRRE